MQAGLRYDGVWMIPENSPQVRGKTRGGALHPAHYCNITPNSILSIIVTLRSTQGGQRDLDAGDRDSRRVRAHLPFPRSKFVTICAVTIKARLLPRNTALVAPCAPSCARLQEGSSPLLFNTTKPVSLRAARCSAAMKWTCTLPNAALPSSPSHGRSHTGGFTSGFISISFP